MTIEAMKQALKALDYAAEEVYSELDDDIIGMARRDLRKAIEQAEKQEPVMWLREWSYDGDAFGSQVYDTESECLEDAAEDGGICSQLYKTPLKDFEIEQAIREERGGCHQIVWDYGYSRVDNKDVQEACKILTKRILARGKK